MSDIRSLVSTEVVADTNLVAPNGGALVFVADRTLIACDRPGETSEHDDAWLDETLDSFGVTHLPPPSYIVDGELAGWRCWTVPLA